MDNQYQHPMRDLSVIVYQKVSGQSGPAFIAKYEPFHVYPVFFSGDTEHEARMKAKAFADDAVTKHEATYQVRRGNAEKARAARSDKRVRA
jgi:hypothetical protein